MNSKISRNGLLKTPYDELVYGTNTFGVNMYVLDEETHVSCVQRQKNNAHAQTPAIT